MKPIKSFLAAILVIVVSLTDRKSTRLNSSHVKISYAVFCWKIKKIEKAHTAVLADCHHRNWGGGAVGAGRYYFWGEPIYGYYRGEDYWVHLRKVLLIADAKG